ncbi:unnamed protein product [Moneuplotes crassus]|uniref:Uncharacterized protein n=1 Tax=Euplotes crassus TaxID=5936 RepID=A0AAD1UJG5_EUPCR|nr:unnamed protein product [Moneuplotes crassus]
MNIDRSSYKDKFKNIIDAQRNREPGEDIIEIEQTFGSTDQIKVQAEQQTKKYSDKQSIRSQKLIKEAKYSTTKEEPLSCLENIVRLNSSLSSLCTLESSCCPLLSQNSYGLSLMLDQLSWCREHLLYSLLDYLLLLFLR